jgi:hypothetical protein
MNSGRPPEFHKHCQPAARISVTLNFAIKRSRNGGAPVNVGSTYTFSTLATVLEAEAFISSISTEIWHPASIPIPCRSRRIPLSMSRPA